MSCDVTRSTVIPYVSEELSCLNDGKWQSKLIRSGMRRLDLRISFLHNQSVARPTFSGGQEKQFAPLNSSISRFPNNIYQVASNGTPAIPHRSCTRVRSRLARNRVGLITKLQRLSSGIMQFQFKQPLTLYQDVLASAAISKYHRLIDSQRLSTNYQVERLNRKNSIERTSVIVVLNVSNHHLRGPHGLQPKWTYTGGSQTSQLDPSPNHYLFSRPMYKAVVLCAFTKHVLTATMSDSFKY